MTDCKHENLKCMDCMREVPDQSAQIRHLEDVIRGLETVLTFMGSPVSSDVEKDEITPPVRYPIGGMLED